MCDILGLHARLALSIETETVNMMLPILVAVAALAILAVALAKLLGKASTDDAPQVSFGRQWESVWHQKSCLVPCWSLV